MRSAGAGGVLEAAPRGQFVVEAVEIRQEAEQPVALAGSGHRVDAPDPRAPRERLDQGRETAQQRAFPGAVRPDERGDAPAGDRERDAVEGAHPRVLEDQILNVEYGNSVVFIVDETSP